MKSFVCGSSVMAEIGLALLTGRYKFKSMVVLIINTNLGKETL